MPNIFVQKIPFQNGVRKLGYLGSGRGHFAGRFGRPALHLFPSKLHILGETKHSIFETEIPVRQHGRLIFDEKRHWRNLGNKKNPQLIIKATCIFFSKISGGSIQKRRGWKSPRCVFAPPSRCDDTRCWVDKNNHDQRFCPFHRPRTVFRRRGRPHLSTSLFTRRWEFFKKPTHSKMHFLGSPWRDMRAKLSPSFTSGRMKMYFPMIMDTVKELLAILEPKAQGQEVVDCKVRHSISYKEIIKFSPPGNGSWFYDRRNRRLLLWCIKQQHAQFIVRIPPMGSENFPPFVGLFPAKRAIFHVAWSSWFP